MKLLTFIDIFLNRSPLRMSDSSRDKGLACQTALQAFVARRGGADVGLGEAVASRFLLEFGRFLARDYRTVHDRPYSPATCREVMRTLRKYLRLAAAEGLVPNIDGVPAVLEQLGREEWPDAGCPERGRAVGRGAAAQQRQDLKVRQAVHAMLRQLDAWATKQQMGTAGKGPVKGIGEKDAERQRRQEALQCRCAAVYLFCLLSGGIEIRDALAIAKDWEGPGLPESVYVARLGRRVALTPVARKLVGLYNQGSVCTGHLFFTLDNRKYPADLDQAAALIEGHVAGYLARQGLPLFKRRQVYIDWLNYGLESGLHDYEAERLWEARRSGSPAGSEAALGAVESPREISGEISGEMLGEVWYLMSIIPLSVKRERMLKMLVASGILGSEAEAAKRIYAPEERDRSRLRGETAVFSRYIFFRATPVQAQFANSFSPYAYVIRDHTRERFARIGEEELRRLQVMLRDFPDAVELVDGERWLADHNSRIVEGCRAVIRSGSLAGKEARVMEVKGRKSGRPTYLIEFVEGAVKFHTALEGIELDLVRE